MPSPLEWVDAAAPKVLSSACLPFGKSVFRKVGARGEEICREYVVLVGGVLCWSAALQCTYVCIIAAALRPPSLGSGTLCALASPLGGLSPSSARPSTLATWWVVAFPCLCFPCLGFPVLFPKGGEGVPNVFRLCLPFFQFPNCPRHIGAFRIVPHVGV